MSNIYEVALKEAGALDPKLPAVFEAVQKVISPKVPYKMRGLMTASELITFAGHLRRNINLNGSSIPVNAIGILIGDSGKGKGRALNALQKVLKPALKEINVVRIAQAKQFAVESAALAGKPESKWRDFHSKPRDLVTAISTMEGWRKHMNALEDGKLGAGTLYVDEIASELASSKELMELLISLSVLYDHGGLPVKVLKSDENQGKAIDNLPVNALLFGSPAGFMSNDAVKAKFIDEASSKLARRCIAYFSREKQTIVTYDDVEQARESARTEAANIKEVNESLTPWFTSLVHGTSHVDLEPSQEALDTLTDYTQYNEIVGDAMSMLQPLAKIHREHRQWAAFKVAGALAILEGANDLNQTHMIEAINFIELYADDLGAFEDELNKEKYELFADYMASIAAQGYANISVHKLRKLGYVKGTGSPQAKLLELIDLAKSYDDINRYEYSEGYIHFYEDSIVVSNEREELA